MAKLQVKTEKIINLIEKLKRTLRENNDISLFIRGDEKNKRIVLDYSACERRTDLYSLAKQHCSEVNKFISTVNESKLVKGKMKEIKLSIYENDTEYSEYESNFGESAVIEKVGQVKLILERFKRN